MLFTSEFVSPGHPDRVMDICVDAVLDALIDANTSVRVALDGLLKNNYVFLGGEVRAEESVDYGQIIKETVKEIGYLKPVSSDFNYEDVRVLPLISNQSPDIAVSVDNDTAGDNGIMFGGAIQEAPDLTGWAHYLSRYIAYKVFNKGFSWARPDQKYQVTVEYKDGVAVGIHTIIACISHGEGVEKSTIEEEIQNYLQEILTEVSFPEGFDSTSYTLLVNPTGVFSKFGPAVDSGVVGRKLVCDLYGGYFPIGGGALSGKDATKVDRSGAYMARFLAKNLVANGYADKACVQVSYGIGVKDPIALFVDCHGTLKVSEAKLKKALKKFSFAPKDIITRFALDKKSENRTFMYRDLPKWGQIGERFDGSTLPWEEVISL